MRAMRCPSERGNISKRWRAGWTVNSIVTLQGGFPFTPQLSYNPSNNGDTRNPVRPFVNPAFTGPVILGNPNQWFNPAAFLAPPNSSGFYGNLGQRHVDRAGSGHVGFVLSQGHADSGKTQSSVSGGVVQSSEPGQLQHAERDRVYADGGFADGGRDHQHVDHVAADSIRTEAALVIRSYRLPFTEL